MSNGTKIRIDADLSGIDTSLNNFRDKAKQAFSNLNGKASIDTAAAKRGIEELEKSVEDLHKSLSGTSFANAGAEEISKISEGFEEAVKNAKSLEDVVSAMGAGGTSGFSKTTAETRKLINELERVKRLQNALKDAGHPVSFSRAQSVDAEYQRRLGAGGTSTRRFSKFKDLASVVNNWRDISPFSENQSGRERDHLLESLGVKKSSFSEFFKDTTRRSIHGVVNSVTPNTGVAGSIMRGGFASAGEVEGGALSGAGLARLGTAGLMAGGVLAAVKVAGAVHAKMRASEDEGTNYADLNRQLGNTAASFSDLRSAIRGASKAIDVTYGEGSKLGMAYVRHAGIDRISNENLRKELGTSGGFGRSMGLDPAQSVELFAALRHNKVSNNDNDNRKLALLIGDTIARSNSFSKADDVLAAITNFTQQATRASFTAANVEGYSGGMGNLLRTKFDGMDPNAVSSLLGHADGAIKSGGSPAAHNFFLGMMQQAMPNMDATDIGFLSDGGAFGTARKQFGDNSPAMRMAVANNDTSLIAKYQKFANQGGNTTNIDRIFNGMSGMPTQAMKESIKGYFGYSDSEAAAMMTAYRANGNSLSSAVNGISKYNIDPSKLKDTSMKSILTAEYGDHSDREGMAKYLRGLTGDQKLTGEENRLLSDAQATPGDNDSKFKEALIKIASTRDMELSEGDISRKNLATLDNMASDIATKLIPLTNSVREAVVAVANKLTFGAFKDKFGESSKARAKLEEDLSKLKSPEERANRILQEGKIIKGDEDSFTDEYKKSIFAQLSESEKKIAPAMTTDGKVAGKAFSKDKADFLEKTRPMAEAAAKTINDAGGSVKPEWLQAQWGLETGWGKSVLDGTNNIGNIKATPNWRGEKKTFNVPENRPDGSVERKNQDFRVYSSLDEAGKDYAKTLLSNSRYYKAIDSRDKKEFAYQMGRSGYATDPSYGNKLYATIDAIEKNSISETNKVSQVSPAKIGQSTSTVKLPEQKVAQAQSDAKAPFGMMSLPNGASSASPSPSQQMFKFMGEFTLKDLMGRSVADPIMPTPVIAPRAAGVR